MGFINVQQASFSGESGTTASVTVRRPDVYWWKRRNQRVSRFSCCAKRIKHLKRDAPYRQTPNRVLGCWVGLTPSFPACTTSSTPSSGICSLVRPTTGKQTAAWCRYLRQHQAPSNQTLPATREKQQGGSWMEPGVCARARVLLCSPCLLTAAWNSGFSTFERLLSVGTINN